MSNGMRWVCMGVVCLGFMLAGVACETTQEGGTVSGRCNATHIVRTPFVARECGDCRLPQGHSGRHHCDTCDNHF